MNFLVIKHVIAEGLGIFEQFCYEAGIIVDVVELEKGDEFPNLEGYSALWVMGGPMNAGDVDDYPWLVEEKMLIRHAVEDLNLPYMGICLGAQLLADTFDGEVGFMPAPEVGLLPIDLTEAGRSHPLMSRLPQTFKVLQWHGQEVTYLPAGATVLASSPQCRIQAFAIGDRTFGLQFHSEVTEVTVEDWVQIPVYRADLEAALGATGCDDLKQAVTAQLPIMNREAKMMFDNFLKIVQGA
ncbi:type 1 glutamine amidotransferase [Phormidium tenue FACHB-886]|nr:type 1 glutamine amidotransferase [Phormidium tenue FACHB-886]